MPILPIPITHSITVIGCCFPKASAMKTVPRTNIIRPTNPAHVNPIIICRHSLGPSVAALSLFDRKLAKTLCCWAIYSWYDRTCGLGVTGLAVGLGMFSSSLISVCQEISVLKKNVKIKHLNRIMMWNGFNFFQSIYKKTWRLQIIYSFI